MSFRAMAWAARYAVPKHRKELKGLPLAVYYALCDTANDKTLIAFPSVFRLAAQCDCDKSGISRSTKHLQKLGLIRVKHFKGANNRYLINIPKWFRVGKHQFHRATESRIEEEFEPGGEPIPAEFDGAIL